MKTLDRYILRNFLTSWALWFIVFMLLRVMTDLFVNMDEFAEHPVPLPELVQWIATYYGYQSLVYFTELGGVLTVAAAAFALAVMNRTNELTAILASGISLRRVIVPIVLCSLGMGGLIVADREFVIPRVKQKLVRSRDSYKYDTLHYAFRPMVDATNAVWQGKILRPAEGVVEHPIVVLRDEGWDMVARLHGREARPGKLGRQRGWWLYDAALVRTGAGMPPWPQVPDTSRIHCTLDPRSLLRRAQQGETGSVPIRVDEVDEVYSLRLQAELFQPDPYDPEFQGRPRTGTLERPLFAFFAPDGQPLGTFYADRATWVPDPQRPRDAGHWQLENGQLFYASDLTVQDIVLWESGSWLEYMSVSEINSVLESGRCLDRNATLLARHIRFTEPINNLIMLLLGLPFILSRERNIKASATLTLLIVGTFYVFIYICRQMGLPPALAAWSPILIFGPISVVMFDSVKT